VVPVTLTNSSDPARALRFDALVDTGAFGLVLPVAWKERVGLLPHAAPVEVETADQRIVTAEICGPVRIQIDGFRVIDGEVVFMDMAPTGRGYEPLVGYTVLELAGAVVDMVTHRLVARRTFDLKRVPPARSPGVHATA
jgi:predicted aspartyl protease